jgi:hypothetical protein
MTIRSARDCQLSAASRARQSHADYVATFEFGNKVHTVSRLSKASEEYTGKIDRLVYTGGYSGGPPEPIINKQGGFNE